MKTKLPLLLILLIILSGCKKNNQSSSAPNAPSSSAPPQSQLNHIEGGGGATPTLAEIKYFKGTIGDSLDLQMKLLKTGDQITGSYYYLKVGTKIDLKGSVDKDGNVTIDEYDTAGKQTGTFKGLWKTDAEDGLITIAGNWSKPAGEKADDKKTAFSVHEEPIMLSYGSDVVTKQIKESNKKLVYEIAAQYPEITGAGNTNFDKFNQLVRASITKKVAGFKKEMAPEEGEEDRPENSMGSDLTIGYDFDLAQDDLISLTFSVSSYYQGAAHPNSYSETINYDLKNGKLLKLADLFKPGAKYLPAISAYCIDDLKKQSKEKDGILDDDSIKSGAAPTVKNYQSWTIGRKGLGINFDPYQVGPYAAGPQYVVVPYSTLKDLINPDGPLAQFAK
ncbi:MAG TPA: DUF3298 domain-containing protein [Pyrinomonadaceae bacterium]